MTHDDDVLDQAGYTIRAEWGPRGVSLLAPVVDVVVIVDVLSFTTCVDLAAARGAFVLPYPLRGPSAAEFARREGALLAGDNPLGLSLKPHSLEHIEAGCRLVLPSPNGSTLSTLSGDVATLAGCLRNARAVAKRAARIGGAVAVVPAGERWHDDSLRPCVEDGLGAGAVITHLAEALGPDATLSPEAEALRATFGHAEHQLPATLAACGSGREKRAMGLERDIELAAALDVSEVAPQLVAGVYQRSLEP